MESLRRTSFIWCFYVHFQGLLVATADNSSVTSPSALTFQKTNRRNFEGTSTGPRLLLSKLLVSLWLQLWLLSRGWTKNLFQFHNCPVGASPWKFPIDFQPKTKTNTYVCTHKHTHTKKGTVEKLKKNTQVDTEYTKSCIIQIRVLLCRVDSNFCLSQTQIHLHADLPALLLW